MAFRSFESFEALRKQLGSASFEAAPEYEILRVAARVEADDGAAAANTCRAVIHDWARSRSGGELPPAAENHGSFSFSDGLWRCEGIRIESAETDTWALRLRHSDGADAGRVWITEVDVEAPAGRHPEFRLRVLLDRDPSSPDFEPRVPEILGKIASRLELRQFGEPICADPWFVDSPAEAERLCQILLAPDRRRPVIVLSVPEGAPEPCRPLLDPVLLTRAALGLASVVVLPAAFTWNLTRNFDKRLAVYNGAVRLYLPGFSRGADERKHCLILGGRLESWEGAMRCRAEILRRVAEQSLHSQPAWSFEEVRELARQTAPREEPAPPAAPSPVEPLEDDPASPEAAELVPASGPPAAPKQTAVEEAAAPEPPSQRPSGALRRLWKRARRLARLLSRTPARLAGEDSERAKRERENAALRGRIDELVHAVERAERTRRESEAESSKEKEFYLSEYEQAFRRAEAAERQRSAVEEQLGKRVRQLTDQLQRHGRIPHPETWKDMRQWCEEALGGSVALQPGAVQGIKKAEFDDLWLAAECLLWLAGPYRESRIASTGRKPDIEKEVDSRLSDGPAGKSVQFKDWSHVPRHERRNISRGNNRERKNCLRIYYYWDETAGKVVIVSMPHHAHTRAS